MENIKKLNGTPNPKIKNERGFRIEIEREIKKKGNENDISNVKPIRK